MRSVVRCALPLLVASCLLVACSPTNDGEDEDLAGGEDEQTVGWDGIDSPDGGDAAAPAAYPAGPYGKEVGKTIKNHSFRDPAAKADVHLADLYKGDKKILMINASAGWCMACKQEAIELKALYDKYSGKGLEIWFTLFEDYNGEPADEAFWKSWTGTTSPNYPVLLDTEYQLGAYYNKDETPLNLMIRLDTMTIVFLHTGFEAAAVEEKLAQLLD
jgi:hypothetical protein